jgi:hypothetical protein
MRIVLVLNQIYLHSILNEPTYLPLNKVGQAQFYSLL